MIRLFQPRPTRDDAVFAEALSLLQDGLDVDFVVGLYPEEAEWLEAELRAADSLSAAYAEAQPSYFFEGSLKAKFLAAARDRTAQPYPVPAEPTTWLGMVRSAAATMTMVGGAALVGVVMLGFITAENAVPGDWNYSFKLAGERFQYTTSRGDDRIDLQISFTQNRVQEIQKKFESGEQVSIADLEKVEREARDLATRLQDRPVDESSKAKLTELGETAATVLNAVSERGPELAPRVAKTIEQVNDAVSAGTGGVATLPTPTATPEPTPTPTPDPTQEPEPTKAPEPNGGPVEAQEQDDAPAGNTAP